MIDPEDLDQLADLECPECGPLIDDEGQSVVSEWDLDQVFGDMTCPDCGADLEQTMEATLGFLAMVTERIPALGPEIAKRLAEALDP